MTLLADRRSRLFIQKGNLYIPAFIMTEVAAHTGRRILIDRLPPRQKNMEMIVEVLFLHNGGMTL